MSAQLQAESKVPIGRAFTPAPNVFLQRKCACGSHAMAGSECEECAKNKGILQRKLAIGASNDPLEREADRVADQVMSEPLDSAINNTPSRIQRFSGQTNENVDTAPSSVDRVLASSGRPLEPSLRQDMEARFGHDFSQVRVHTGNAAEQSARDVNAHAYTVGKNIVFGKGKFVPGSLAGQRLIAHELTHVVQQRGGPVTSEGGVHISSRPLPEATMVARESASWGEKWDALWGVGPFDALTASTLSDEALAAARATGLPGVHNGPADAWRHCFWNCNMTHALGYDQAETIATNHERHGGGPANENQMDQFNNEVGRNCGGTNCDGCCQSALDAGRLRVIDSTGAVVSSTMTVRSGSVQPGTSYSGSYYSNLPPARRPAPPREPVWHCFTGRMTLTMADGKEVPLEQVVVGDQVLAYDDAERRLRACVVIACHKHPPAEYLKVWLQDGRLLEVTWNHLLYAGNRWVQAGHLREGSMVYLSDKRDEEGLTSAEVQRIELADGPAQLFDITVAECHNYFVSGVLVHNKNI